MVEQDGLEFPLQQCIKVLFVKNQPSPDSVHLVLRFQIQGLCCGPVTLEETGKHFLFLLVIIDRMHLKVREIYG
jgi:hypothetical protein